MTVSEANGGTGGQEGSPDLSAAATVREAGEDFATSFRRLQNSVSRACSGHSGWQEKVAAGVRATLEFAAAHPARAEALTFKARRRAPDRDDPEGEVTAHFAGLLAEVAPAEMRFPISTDESIVEAIAVVIRGHLLDGTTDELPDKAADLVYLALMPYLGLDETRRWLEGSALN